MSMESWSTKSRRRKPPDVFTHLLTRPHHNLRIVQEHNRYIMIGTLTGGDPFRLELTELSPEVGVVRQLVA